MIDITKDEFWDAKYEETSRIERKENKVKQFIKDYEIEKIRQVGPFSSVMYFMKSGNGEIGIIKKVKVKTRKELLSNFSGIKLYRDNPDYNPSGT